jgi:hypothetical protein
MVIAKRWNSAIDRADRTRVGRSPGGARCRAYQGAAHVGVLDSGIDYTHEDFRSATTSHLLGLFDFSGGPRRGCRPGQLDSLTCPQIDGSGGFGHGTHVTGIAAGNGRRNPAYVGMAPQADLLFVKGMRTAQSTGGFTDADVVQGVAWMLDKALVAGKPIAVNLSLGGHGARRHLGQEQFMDLFADPGASSSRRRQLGAAHPRLYLVEGNNYNSARERAHHVSRRRGPVGPAGSNAASGSRPTIQHPGAALYVTTAAAPGLQVGRPIFNGIISAGSRSTRCRRQSQQRSEKRWSDRAGGGRIDPSTIIWSIYTFGAGTFDMWVVTSAVFFPPGFESPPGTPPPSYFVPGDDSKTVGMPGTARRILCVGSHVSKTTWVDTTTPCGPPRHARRDLAVQPRTFLRRTAAAQPDRARRGHHLGAVEGLSGGP